MKNSLLFEAATQIALKRAYLFTGEVSELSEENSLLVGNEYLLKNTNGSVISTIKSDEITEILFESGKVPPSDLGKEATQAIAVKWAVSRGYRVPSKMSGCLSWILVIGGLCMWIVPGLLIFGWVWYQGNQYERDMDALIAKWVDAGYPRVGEQEKPKEQLEQVKERSTNSQSTESRLEELLSMRDKGLISSEEYETLRKKALGL